VTRNGGGETTTSLRIQIERKGNKLIELNAKVDGYWTGTTASRREGGDYLSPPKMSAGWRKRRAPKNQKRVQMGLGKKIQGKKRK